MCKREAPEAQILGHFGPPNESKFRFSNILLKRLVWIHISLALYAHWSYFQRCVKYGPQRPNFWTILGPKVRKFSGVWSLSQKVFTGFTTVLLHMLIPGTFRCVENMGLRGPIFSVTLGPQISQNSGLWSFKKKNPTGCASVLVHMSIWSTFRRGVLSIGPRCPISGSFWGPK